MKMRKYAHAWNATQKPYAPDMEDTEDDCGEGPVAIFTIEFNED